MASSLFAGVAHLLARSEPFNLLTEEEREAILRKMTLELYTPGEIILAQGEDVHRALYLVEDGLVRLTEAENGRTIDMVGPGSPISAYGLLQGGSLPFEARAVQETSCALIAADTFRDMIKRNEAFRAYFETDIQRYVRSLDEDIDASGAFLLFDTTLDRLVHGPPPVVVAEASIKEAAQVMADSAADAVVVVRDWIPVGLITEGDIIELGQRVFERIHAVVEFLRVRRVECSGRDARHFLRLLEGGGEFGHDPGELLGDLAHGL